jgi:hypothetical protein
LEQQRESLEAGAFGWNCFNEGGTFGGG